MKKILLFSSLFVLFCARAFALEGFLKQSTAVNITILMIDSSDHITGKTGLAAGLTIYATKAAGTPATISPTVTELDSTNVKGVYKLALTTSHTDTLGELQLHITATGADPMDCKWQISTYLPGEAATLQADQAVNATKINGVSASSVTTINANIGTTQPINHTGTGASALVKSDTVDWNGQAVVTPNTNGVPIVDTRQIARQGTAQSTGNTTTAIKLDASASATTNFYKYHRIAVISGTGSPESAICTAYDGTTKIATVAPAWPTAPDNTSVFQVSMDAQSDLETIVGAANSTSTAQLGVNVVTNGDKTGYSLSQSFPANFSSLSITGGGAVTVGTNNDKTGYSLSQSFPANFASFSIDANGRIDLIKVAGTSQTARDLGAQLDVTVGSRMATYTQPTGFLAATFPSGTIANTTNITAGTITTTTNLTNLPSIPANWITAAGITAGALNGKGDWVLASSITLTGGKVDINDKTGFSLISAYDPAKVDPLSVILPSTYTGQQAGNLIYRTANKP